MRRRLVVPLVGLLIAVGASTGTATATGGYAPPQRVTASCDGPAVVTSLADTSVWGLSACNAQMSLLHRSASGSWTSRPLPYSGYPTAVADDGHTTFFLFVSGYDPSGNSMSIAKVPHDGRPSAATVLEASSDETVRASLVARDGKWWAVWDETFYGNERQTVTLRLLQARTMEPAFRTRPLDLGTTRDWWPNLALRGTGAVLVASRSDGQGGSQPVLATAGPDGQFTARNLGLALSTSSYAQDMLVAGGRTLVALRDGGRTLLAQDDGNLAFTTRTVATRAPSYSVAIAASYGRVFVAHSESFTASSSGAYTTRAYVAEAGATGPFTTTEVSAPLARTDPAITATLLDVTAARGHATVLTSAHKATWSQTQI